jgi:hypothetical protein
MLPPYLSTNLPLCPANQIIEPLGICDKGLSDFVDGRSVSYTTGKQKVVGFWAEVDKNKELRMKFGLVGALEVAI